MQGLISILAFFIVTFNFIISFGDGSNNMFNLMKFGGNGDGKTDNYNAFSNAWNAACAVEKDNDNVPTLIVPKGSFVLKPFTFQGPCKSDTINIKIVGNIVAPSSDEWPGCNIVDWLVFKDVNGLVVDGSGTIDGRGSTWWGNKEITKKCTENPRSLHFQSCNNLGISGIKHMNSPGAHIGINGCQNVSIYETQIIAPENSPNTDGIDISRSTYVNVFNSTIGTGDDCIAINGGCSFINVTGITCGPGHGISVGSLGRGQEPDEVEEVSVHNCTFINTQNGVRIKTWPGGSGYAKNISFSKIKLQDAENPIIIDQHYCNGAHNCPDKDLAVKVSGITYSGIEGTSASKEAITLDCAKIGCGNIVMEHINITSYNPLDNLQSFCSHVNGTSVSTVPVVPCLKST